MLTPGFFSIFDFSATKQEIVSCSRNYRVTIGNINDAVTQVPPKREYTIAQDKT